VQRKRESKTSGMRYRVKRKMPAEVRVARPV
jgi:hypothetical protein